MSERSMLPNPEGLGRSFGRQKTDLYCHNCNKNFVAVIDYDLDGNHEIECPACAHIHFRVVTKGIVTSDRYDSSNQNKYTVTNRSLWKSETKPIETSTTSIFLRERWLNHSSE